MIEFIIQEIKKNSQQLLVQNVRRIYCNDNNSQYKQNQVQMEAHKQGKKQFDQYLNHQYNHQELRSINNLNKISESTLRFKSLIQTLRRKKHWQSQEPNISQSENINHELNQTQAKNLQKTETNTQNQKSRLKVQIECKQKQKDINQDMLASKRTKLFELFQLKNQNNFHYESTIPIVNNNNVMILNPKLINKSQLNNYCKSIKSSNQIKSNDSLMSKNIKYPTIAQTQMNHSIISKVNQAQNRLNQQNSIIKKIKDIQQSQIKLYCQQSALLTSASKPEQIYDFFTNLCVAHYIQIQNPFIKKYKNCIFYGRQPQLNEKYEGFLYYYQKKFYYGDFLNQQKYGQGVQIDFQGNKVWKGEFLNGRKTGKFFFKCQTKQYIGYMLNGLYHGQGKLKTNESIYQGFFQSGLKNGYGQEYFPKTGLRISGVYTNDQFEKAQMRRIKISSQPQLPKKQKIKQKSIQRVLNKKLKQKLQFIINPESTSIFNKQQQKHQHSNDLRLKFPDNMNKTNKKQLAKKYLSQRKSSYSYKKSEQIQKQEQLQLQNIYLEHKKFKKVDRLQKSRNIRQKQRQRQRKDSSLSVIRINSHQEQVPLVPYFYALKK